MYKLFRSSGNKEFLLFVLTLRNDMDLKDIICKLDSVSLPLDFVSGLVNIQMCEYDLPKNTHFTYEDLLSDAVVRGDFVSESLRLVLVVVLAETKFRKKIDGERVSINLSDIINTLITCRKYIQFKEKVVIDIDDYVNYFLSSKK